MGVATPHAPTVTVGWEPAKTFCHGSFYCGQLLSQKSFHKKFKAKSKLAISSRKPSVTANFSAKICYNLPYTYPMGKKLSE